jgi:hypothetical protein
VDGVRRFRVAAEEQVQRAEAEQPQRGHRRPMMEPPKKATVSASAAPLVWAAVVVREFAWVAVYMPMKPARAEAPAPTTKASAVFQPRKTYSGTRPRPQTARASCIRGA